jgi:hypothetical protein
MTARKKPKLKPSQRRKVRKTLHEFKTGSLRSGSKQGPKVKSRRQAVAIALSQARKVGRKRKRKASR